MVSPAKPPLVNLPCGYRPLRLLGRGAFGEVWHAEAPGGVEVAIKFIHRTSHANESESELTALHLIKGLRHQNLLALQAFFPLPEWLVIVLELADGSLRQRLRQWRDDGQVGIPSDELLPYLREAAEALDFLHGHELQHRDIKPDNILLLGQHVKVADYGVARLLEKSSLQSASVVGTPAYMAPEVCMGKVSQHSDQYSLAVTYAELRLGRLPILAENLAQMVFRKMHGTPELNPLPEAEQQVLLRALAQEPDQRYPSCSALALALMQALPHQAVMLPAVAGTAGAGSTVDRPVQGSRPRSTLPGGRTNAEPETDELQPQKASTLSPRQTLVHTVVPVMPSTHDAGRPARAGGGWLLPALLAVALTCAVSWRIWHSYQSQEPDPGPQASLATPTPESGPAPRAEPAVPKPAPQAGPLKLVAETKAAQLPEPPRTVSETRAAKPPRIVPETTPARPPEPPPVARLRLLPLEEVTLDAGSKGTLPVKVVREHCQGAVKVEIEGLPAGVHVQPLVLADRADTARLELTADDDATDAEKVIHVRAKMKTVQDEQTARVVIKVTPRLRLEPLAPVVMQPDQWQYVRVQVERRKVYEPITLDLAGVPVGVTVKGVWPPQLAPSQTSAVVMLHSRRDVKPGTWTVRVRAATATMETESKLRLETVPPRSPEERLAAENKAVRRTPLDPAAYVNRGRTYRELGNVAQALADYDKALLLDPQYAPAYNSRGNTYRVAGNYDKALADLTEAIRLNPKYGPPYSDRGFVFYLKKEYEQTVKDCDTALALDPSNAAAHVNRGRAFHARGDLDRALADFDAAIRLDPGNAAAYCNRAYVHERKKDYDGAFKDYNQAVLLNPRFPQGWNGRGYIHSQTGDLAQALADYSEAIKLDPRFALAYRNRGNAYLSKKDYDLAIADYEEALRLGPRFAVVYRNRGNAYRLKKDYDSAIADFTEAIRLDSKYADAYLLRNLARRAKGDIAGADADLKTANLLRPLTRTTTAQPLPISGLALGEVLRVSSQLTAADPRDNRAPTHRKVYTVWLARDKSYLLEMHVEARTLAPVLRLEDADGKELRRQGSDDGQTVRFRYEPPATGMYRVIVTTRFAGQTGPYRLTVREVAPPGAVKSR
jgi:tetratricopeptide (TPR) repeat protein/serine/threonine protein kinase